ncbi:hypothetical protein HDU76_000042 [Blyttiomyces sp. JEL0837]|nr:hypothetical protein HDU76_000042 [Blyttiomyces sp. JEL0837]
MVQQIAQQQVQQFSFHTWDAKGRYRPPTTLFNQDGTEELLQRRRQTLNQLVLDALNTSVGVPSGHLAFNGLNCQLGSNARSWEPLLRDALTVSTNLADLEARISKAASQDTHSSIADGVKHFVWIIRQGAIEMRHRMKQKQPKSMPTIEALFCIEKLNIFAQRLLRIVTQLSSTYVVNDIDIPQFMDALRECSLNDIFCMNGSKDADLSKICSMLFMKVSAAYFIRIDEYFGMSDKDSHYLPNAAFTRQENSNKPRHPGFIPQSFNNSLLTTKDSFDFLKTFCSRNGLISEGLGENSSCVPFSGDIDPDKFFFDLASQCRYLEESIAFNVRVQIDKRNRNDQESEEVRRLVMAQVQKVSDERQKQIKTRRAHDLANKLKWRKEIEIFQEQRRQERIKTLEKEKAHLAALKIEAERRDAVISQKEAEERKELENRFAKMMADLEKRIQRQQWLTNRLELSEKRSNLMQTQMENPEVFWKEFENVQEETTADFPNSSLVPTTVGLQSVITLDNGAEQTNGNSNGDPLNLLAGDAVTAEDTSISREYFSATDIQVDGETQAPPISSDIAVESPLLDSFIPHLEINQADIAPVEAGNILDLESQMIEAEITTDIKVPAIKTNASTQSIEFPTFGKILPEALRHLWSVQALESSLNQRQDIICGGAFLMLCHDFDLISELTKIETLFYLNGRDLIEDINLASPLTESISTQSPSFIIMELHHAIVNAKDVSYGGPLKDILSPPYKPPKVLERILDHGLLSCLHETLSLKLKIQVAVFAIDREIRTFIVGLLEYLSIVAVSPWNEFKSRVSKSVKGILQKVSSESTTREQQQVIDDNDISISNISELREAVHQTVSNLRSSNFLTSQYKSLRALVEDVLQQVMDICLVTPAPELVHTMEKLKLRLGLLYKVLEKLSVPNDGGRLDFRGGALLSLTLFTDMSGFSQRSLQ